MALMLQKSRTPMYDEPIGIFERRMNFSPSASHLTTDLRYQVCEYCDQYLCLSGHYDYPLVFTDGACSHNGYRGAECGIGGAFGDLPGYQWSIPVDDYVDSSSVRTNQRAELLAAIEGVRRLGDFLREGTNCNRDTDSMVVATDSEYVCKGVTEWMPRWKENGWVNSRGRSVANSDLFCKLDEVISEYEDDQMDVGFWWIPREYNQTADSLAKDAV